jgi:hypothetical protein
MALTDILPEIQDPRVVNQQATAAYMRNLPTTGQRLNQEMSVATAPMFGPGAIGHGGIPEQAAPLPGNMPSATFAAVPRLTPIVPASAPQRAVDRAGVEAAWNALDARYRAQDVNAPPEVAPTAAASAPFFPDTIAGRIARQSNALEQRQANKQTELGQKQQEIGNQAQNAYSESALRAVQGRALGGAHMAEIAKARLTDEYLSPDTDEARRERIAHVLGVIKPENTEAEKDVMGLFTGRVLNKSTGEIRGGSTKATPAEGSRHQDAQGNIAVWQNGKYVPVPK